MWLQAKEASSNQELEEARKFLSQRLQSCDGAVSHCSWEFVTAAGGNQSRRRGAVEPWDQEPWDLPTSERVGNAKGELTMAPPSPPSAWCARQGISSKPHGSTC